MTLELGRISRRLTEAGYPDGGKIVRSVADGLSVAGLIPDQLPTVDRIRGQETICKLLENARVGQYVDTEKLAESLTHSDITKNSMRNVRRAVKDIEENGNESLFHLALTMREIHPIRRKGIRSITELRAAFENATIYDVRNLSPERIRRISEALRRFDELASLEASK
jgi:hypothetical protein